MERLLEEGWIQLELKSTSMTSSSSPTIVIFVILQVFRKMTSTYDNNCV
jgi:hypothetical protein